MLFCVVGKINLFLCGDDNFFKENIYSSGKCNAVGCHGALE